MKRWLLISIIPLVLLSVLLGFTQLAQSPFLIAVERGLLELRAPLAPVPERSPVTLIRLSDSEADRELLAGLIERLTAQGVRAILVHVPLASPGSGDMRLQLRSLSEAWGRTPGAAHNPLWQRIRQDLRDLDVRLDADARLAESLRAAGNVVLSVALSREGGAPLKSLEKYALRLNVRDRDWQERLRHFSTPLLPPWPEMSTLQAGLPWGELPRQAAAVGYVLPVEGLEISAGQLLLPVEERYFPSAVLATLAVGERTPLRALAFVDRGAVSTLRVGKHSYPVDHRLRLDVLPPAWLAPLPVLEAKTLLAAPGVERDLAGQAVVIGAFAQTSAPEFGAAHLLAQLLGDFQLARPGWLPLVELLVLALFALCLGMLVPRLPPVSGVVMMVLLILGWLGAATVLLVTAGWWFQVTPPVVLTAVSLWWSYLLRGARQRKERLAELHCTLGELLQDKGLLDRALEAFRACPPGHAKAREHLYSLGLDYERKRRFGQALAVYEQLARGGRYKDVAERLTRLRSDHGGVSLGGAARDATVVLTQGGVFPTLGRYEIVKELGQGAMGTVYLGRDPKINREVAIKTLAYGTVDDTQLPMIKERFFREAEAAGRLNHPGIVTIFDAGEEHDLAYLAMEFLRGHDLSRHCRPQELLPYAEVLRVVADVAEALAYAHAHEVVHRDIKPANIMRLQDGSVKVTDFGIARVVSNSQTQTGMVLGTPSYMSPEQVAAKKVDGRSDLFSLGAVCYELLCGEKAFVGDSMAALMYNIANVSYTPLREKRKGLPRCCYELVESLLVKSVSRRPKDAGVVAEAARFCSERKK